MHKNLLVKLVEFCLFFYLANSYAYSQGQGIVNPEFLPKVTVSSPEASALGRYGDFNVSEYTGSLDISVPFYNIQLGKFNYPIQLKYSTSGVKVDDIHSWVGSNWSLFGVGLITRTIVGLPDESGAGFLTRNIGGNSLKNNYELSNIGDVEQLSLISDNLIDSEPDLFYFNFGRYSGRFYFDKQGNFTCIPANTLKLIKSAIITNSPHTDSEWHLQDMEGNDYFFAQAGVGIETTTEEEYSLDQHRISSSITGWYLTKIRINGTSDEINFQYGNKVENYTLPVSQSVRYILSRNLQYPLSANAPYIFNEGVLMHNGVALGQNIPGMPMQTPLLKDLFFGGNCRLEKITFPSGSVDFIANTQRIGMAFGSKMLDKVIVKGLSGEIVQSYEILYEVFNKRYFVNEVKVLGQGDKYLSSYKMDYTWPGALPTASAGMSLVTSQDHWGYFNGRSNPSLVPNDFSINSNFASLTGNREPDPIFMRYGSINKITYPTGGYSEFDFEAHEYNSIQSAFINVPQSAIVNKNINGSITQTNGIFESQFVVNYEQHNANLVINFSDYQHAAGEETSWNIDVILSKLDGGSFIPVYSFNAWRLFNIQTAVSLNNNGIFNYSINSPITLTTGTYKVSINRYCVTSCPQLAVLPKASLTLNYMEFSGSLPRAGGLRIKEVRNYSNGVLASRRVYEYSAGNLLSYPKYSHIYGTVMNDAIDLQDGPNGNIDLTFGFCLFLDVYFKEYTSTSQNILGFTNGATVGYEIVKISDYDKNDEDNGYTVKFFSFFNDVLNEHRIDGSHWARFGFVNLLNPSNPADNLEYKRGLLLREILYRKRPNKAYEFAKSSVYNYHYGDQDIQNRYKTLMGIRVKRIFDHRNSRVCTSTFNNSFSYPAAIPFSALFAYSKYHLISSWPRLIQKEVVEYSENGGSLSYKEDYNYNDPVHLQPTEILTRNSKGEELRRSFSYTNNYSDVNLRNQLIARNMIGEVVNEDVAIKKGTVFNPLVRQRKVFESYNNGAQLLAGRYFIDYQNVITSTPEYEILRVLPGGKPFEVKKRDGINEIYLWGYNNQHILVKVFGVSSDQINTFLGYNLFSALPGLSSSQLISLGEALRSMPNANVESYDYIPLVGLKWQKDIKGRNTTYEYDAFNRLLHVRDHDGNIIKQYCYNYAGQQVNCFDVTYTNSVAYSANFTRSNCGTGFTGSTVTFNVPIGSVTSLISVADANAKAQAKLNAEGQAFANSSGSCVPSSSCGPSMCTNMGPMFACINGSCEEGIQIYTGQVLNNGTYSCRYHYEWSNGTRSIDYFIPSFGSGCLSTSF